MKFIIQFVQFHTTFRLPELESLSVLEGVPIQYDPESYRDDSPYLVVEIESACQAIKLVRRGILIRSVIEYLGHNQSMDLLRADIRSAELPASFMTESFKFSVDGIGRRFSHQEQVELIESMKFLGFRGPIRMSRPQNEFYLGLEYLPNQQGDLPQGEPWRVWFGRVLGHGSRSLVDRFDVKKRRYLGNTTMDAELSLVMANQALARPGTLVYDPFVGTGSFLLTCSHWGAMSLGSDIDGRQIRGTAGFKRGVDGIRANLDQYGLKDRVLDTVVFDICRSPWKDAVRFDAIVTDPPYGVRAGAKRLGRRQGNQPERSLQVVDGVENYKRSDYLPPTQPYEMSEVVDDLLELAAQRLCVGGRLVYWLPTVTNEYQPSDLPTHPALRLVADSVQPFGGWSRRLVTMEKCSERKVTDKTAGAETPAHKNFRERYFSKFE